MPPLTKADDLRRSIPSDRAIYFLRAKDPFVNEETGRRVQYFRLVSSQGLVRDIDGRSLPGPAAEDAFLLELVHTPFAKTLEDVSAAASN